MLIVVDVPRTLKLPWITKSFPTVKAVLIICVPPTVVFERTTVLSVPIVTVSEPPEPVTVVTIPVLPPWIVNVPPPACVPEPVLPATVNWVSIATVEILDTRPLAATVITGIAVVEPYWPAVTLAIVDNTSATLALPVPSKYTELALTSPWLIPMYLPVCNAVAVLALPNNWPKKAPSDLRFTRVFAVLAAVAASIVWVYNSPPTFITPVPSVVPKKRVLDR